MGVYAIYLMRAQCVHERFSQINEQKVLQSFPTLRMLQFFSRDLRVNLMATLLRRFICAHRGGRVSFCYGDHLTGREITRCDEARKTLLNYSLAKYFYKRICNIALEFKIETLISRRNAHRSFSPLMPINAY